MTHSGDPWTASGMKNSNKQHEAPVRAFLKTVVNDPPRHARFMNMLSMLEHMGSRKIMVSQMNRPESLTEDTLKHLAEEARHAYFFKRQAERIAGHPLDGFTDENTMQRVPALMYFGRLDAGISAHIKKMSSRWPSSQSEDVARTGPSKDEAQSASTYGSPPSSVSSKRREDDDANNLAYPWVSLIIELRACWLYHIYHEELEKSGVQISLKSLLAEEDMHLAEMFEMCGDDTETLRSLSAYETDLFGKLWNKLERDLAMPLAA